MMFAGGCSGSTSILEFSIIEYKQFEEQTLRDAINSMINFTIQEYEQHSQLSKQLKENIAKTLSKTKDSLSGQKKVWK